MNNLLKIDTSRLPKPEQLLVRDYGPGDVCLVITLPTIAAARKWAAALGVEIEDTDPDCEFTCVRQEAVMFRRGQLRVHVIGTQSTTYDEMQERLVIQTATRTTRQAVAL